MLPVSGVLPIHIGGLRWGGAGKIPCSFLRDSTYTVLLTEVGANGVGPLITHQEAVSNFSLMQ